MPRLSELIAGANISPSRVVGDVGCAISAIVSDSREAVPGALFIAISGVQNDGGKYIQDAIARGVVAVVAQQGSIAEWTHPAVLVEVADVRAAVAALAAAFYSEKPPYTYAITGTDGKTSTAEFTRQLLALLGKNAASIGTLGLRSSVAKLDAEFPKNNTSPEPILLHRTLQQLAKHDVQYVAIEASSHGLDQKRLDGIAFTTAAFTNLTRDHLDYHGTLEAYAAAKARLFSELLPAGATAILNRDDAQYESLSVICNQREIIVKTVGYHAASDYRIAAVKPHANGLDATIVFDGQSYVISLPLYGAFQLFNMLTAIGLLQSTGIAVADLVALLPKLHGVPGRLEKVATHPSGAPIFVDYAHTPAALENILKTLRLHTSNKLHVVFGCGGDRDAGKRPEMGHAASQYADVMVVTDDNPRSENPDAIRAAIIVAAPNAIEIAGRDNAIHFAVQQLSAGDVLVVAGKGHEQTQIIGSHVIHFSDAEQIQHAVRA